jgi:hypothetical protein
MPGRKNLVGATKYWLMAIDLRMYLFQVNGSHCLLSSAEFGLTPMQTTATIFQVLPGSPVFRLPALARPDVQLWIKTVFPSELACLQANTVP